MGKYSPFINISADEITGLRDCLCSKVKIYKKGDIIMQIAEADDSLGLVEQGTAHLVRIDVDGNKSIIDYYEAGDVFGKKLAPQSVMDTYYIRAKDNCKITFVNFNKLLAKCENNCDKHTGLLNNILMLTLEKSQMHIDVLSQRSTRQKLITYFDYLSIRNESSTFILPLSLSDLADYLSVDRSAMMREIRRLKNEAIISHDEKKLTLNKNRYGY